MVPQGANPPLTAIKENLHYSLWAFSQSNLANWMTDTTRTVWVLNWWRALYLGCEIVGGIAVAGGVAMYVVSYVFSNKGKKQTAEAEAERSEE